ncbi:FCD domain-containing protein [Streptomyces sp. AF1A]|uniref:FCD domain-containing protein n=1 Tax=Streptomyces sp. AF1A TaxID=3394350 RepID=UPI0039BD17EA
MRAHRLQQAEGPLHGRDERGPVLTAHRSRLRRAADPGKTLEGLCAAKAAVAASDEQLSELSDLGAAMEKAVADGEPVTYSDLDHRLHDRIQEISGQRTAVGLLERLNARLVRHRFQLTHGTPPVGRHHAFQGPHTPCAAPGTRDAPEPVGAASVLRVGRSVRVQARARQLPVDLGARLHAPG